MADESAQSLAWNAYIEKHGAEPSTAQQLLSFTNNKSNKVTSLTFVTARQVFAKNKGKGTVNMADLKTVVAALEAKVKQLEKENTKLKKWNQELLLSTGGDEKADASTSAQARVDKIWAKEGISFLKATHTSKHIQALIRNKVIDVKGVNTNGRTILHLAAYHGMHDLAQLAINMDADLYQKDAKGKRPIDYAAMRSWWQCHQLLLLSELNASVNERIEVTATQINKNKGIIKCFLRVVDEETKLDLDSLVDTMTSLIEKKKAFSDEMLCLCWAVVCRDPSVNPLMSKLWQTISTTCRKIIGAPNHRDFYWLKHFVIPSNIWYHELEATEEHSPNYLYFYLLRYATDQGFKLLSEMESNIKKASDEYKIEDESVGGLAVVSQWHPSDVDRDIRIRQDTIPNGVVAEYTFEEISDAFPSSSSFDSHDCYDYSQYLPRLCLMAQSVDEKFQNSVRQIFDDAKDIASQFLPGPVKLMSRAKTKAQVDYFCENFPTSACVLDFNRCCVVFEDISSMLAGLNAFCVAVSAKKSGVVVGIARCKNGWSEYLRKPDYADIKLNVMIRGSAACLIGEVQFLLLDMMNYKRKNHKLYAIQRQEEYVINSVSRCLPVLLDEKRQLSVAAFLDDSQRMCSLIVCNELTDAEVVFYDNRGECLLVNMLILSTLRTFDVMNETIERKLLLDRLFYAPETRYTAMESAAEYNCLKMMQILFAMDDIKAMLANDRDLMNRFLCALYEGSDQKTIDYIHTTFGIETAQIVECIDYEPTSMCHYEGIITSCIRSNKVGILQHLASLCPRETFVAGAFSANRMNLNALEMAVNGNKSEHCAYLLSFEEIKARYSVDEELLTRLIIVMFTGVASEDTVDLMLQWLKISAKMLVNCLSFANKITPSARALQPTYQTWHFEEMNLLTNFPKRSALPKLQKLVRLIGKEAFVGAALQGDDGGISFLEYCVLNSKKDMLQYACSFPEIGGKVDKDVDVTWKLALQYFVSAASKEMYDELHLSKQKMRKLAAHVSDACGKKKQRLVAAIARANQLDKWTQLVAIIGEAAAVKEALEVDGEQKNAIGYAITGKHVGMVQRLLSMKHMKAQLSEPKRLSSVVLCLVEAYSTAVCQEVVAQLQLDTKVLQELKKRDKRITDEMMKKVLSERTLAEGFVYLSHIDDSIQQNMRYFGENNFVGHRIPGYKKGVCVMTVQAATALSKAQAQLKAKDANLSLKVYDAYRPQKAVDFFATWAADATSIKMKDIFYPAIEDKTDLFKRGYIAAKSGHTRGSTVDLTIVDASKSKAVNSQNMADNSINMGSIFDFFGVRSHYENDVITDKEAIANRKLLHELMKANGFKHYPQEWWHFTLANEPFKDKYFDFDIQ